MAKARKHPMSGAGRRKSKSARVAHTGGWGKKVKRKRAAKKAAKTRAKNKAKRSRAAKKGARKRKRTGGRKNKSSKRKTFRTTTKVANRKVKKRCPVGKVMRATTARYKSPSTGKTWTVANARCVSY